MMAVDGFIIKGKNRQFAAQLRPRCDQEPVPVSDLSSSSWIAYDLRMSLIQEINQLR